MNTTRSVITAGMCAHCEAQCLKRTGKDIWPQRPDLATKVMWECSYCDAWVGSKPNGQPLGTAANFDLRGARSYVHARLDPIWEKAHEHPAYADIDTMNRAGSDEWSKARAIVRNTARARVYRFLADRLGITKSETHVAMMDIALCRKAYAALKGVTYDAVRTWCQDNPDPDKKKPRTTEADGAEV